MSNANSQDESELIEPEAVAYSTPDRREHILKVDDECPKVIKKPKSE